MPSLSPRWGIVYAAAGAAGLIVACSTTPHFVNDLTGGSGGSAATTTSSSTTGTGGGTTSTSTTTTSSTSSSGGAACVVVGDCGMVDTACAHPTCAGGQCSVTFVAMGTATPAQVPGDCKMKVCDGSGDVTAVPDDTDVPDDGNACVVASCTSGTLTQTFAALDAPCGLAGELKCDGNGVCANCNDNLQCSSHLGGGSPCVAWTCSAGKQCLPSYTPAGQGNPGGGATGDCQINVCDGMGGVESVADPKGVVQSPSACVMGACVNGVPTAQPAPAGTACPGSHTCDGAGHCGSCATDTDCGMTTVCAAPVCLGGHCTGTYAPQGPAPKQVPGDCQTTTCDGNGGVTQQVDTGDTPPAEDACHSGVCNGETPGQESSVPTSDTCNAYSCTPSTGVVDTMAPDGTTCNACSVCEAGACTFQCGAGCACSAGVCTC